VELGAFGPGRLRRPLIACAAAVDCVSGDDVERDGSPRDARPRWWAGLSVGRRGAL